MSTIEIARFQPGEAATLESVIRAHTGEFGAIGEYARSLGCLHHRFAAARHELLLIDEWRDIGEAVTKFWGLPEGLALLREAGVQLPAVEVRHYRSISDPTEF
jgi:hypothetical protein